MAMVVQHNLTAMNANRQLGITTGAQAKSSEKLSSGYRINRAGDDAAGWKAVPVPWHDSGCMFSD